MGGRKRQPRGYRGRFARPDTATPRATVASPSVPDLPPPSQTRSLRSASRKNPSDSTSADSIPGGPGPLKRLSDYPPTGSPPKRARTLRFSSKPSTGPENTTNVNSEREPLETSSGPYTRPLPAAARTPTRALRSSTKPTPDTESSADGLAPRIILKASSERANMPSVLTRHPSVTPSVTPSAIPDSAASFTASFASTQSPNGTSSKISAASAGAPSAPVRNIDNVVLGNLLFKAWYPSYHVGEIVGKEVSEVAKNGNSHGKSGAKNGHVGDGNEGKMLERLYVCAKCFKYGKELTSWVPHMQSCTKEIPGRKIYEHPHEKGSGEEGFWSVWEVDGEDEPLFCQNLSLFAKLFLDNKSVFFDVSGFHFFLLIHTTPSTGAQQVVGFFSKEKMSWDNNNLACILIFPPWQRKSLGLLLIGVSYEISRREKLLGGPEKPISDLGKKGYRRYWFGEIARWLLDVGAGDKEKGKGGGKGKGKGLVATVTVEDVSRGVWIEKEDVLACLRELGEVGVVTVVGGRGKEGRVRVDKEGLRRWCRENAWVALERVVDPGGFVEGYGLRGEGDEEMAD